MRRVVIWSVCVVVIVVVLDVLFGLLFNSYIDNNDLPGDYEMTDHLLRKFGGEDVVVLGSSVALNSINTKKIQDSLGLSTFNGGANGQSFPYYNTLLKAILSQSNPRMIILGLLLGNFTNTGKGVRYNFLSPYYGKGISDIDSVLEEGSAFERLMLNSNFYRLNRIWFRIFLYNFVDAGIKGENGFIAKPMPHVYPDRITMETKECISDERLKEFESFISLCRDQEVKLMVVMTPQCVYPSSGRNVVNEVRDICTQNGVLFFDDRNMVPFNDVDSLFYDIDHININGAAIYTDSIINRLRWIFSTKY